VIKEGGITWPPPPPKLSAAPAAPKEAADPQAETKKKKATSPVLKVILTLGISALVFFALGYAAPSAFLSHFIVFVLACFVGYMVVWNVTPSLHTPLMSVTNAISSIIVIGALIQVSAPKKLMMIIAGAAIVLTTINMFGGFWVTQRMLRMFRK
jgi:NAD(P) transhydrogenase subunit alpha